MNFEIAKSELLPRLAVLAKVADGKVVPILADILVTVHNGMLSMTAGNGVTSINCEVDISTIKRTGAATLPAKKLYEIVKKLGNTIEFEQVGQIVMVKSGSSKYELAGQDPLMYPPHDAVNGVIVTVSGLDFKGLIKKTAYAASTNENVKMLIGIRLSVRASKLTATACDRHRLAQVSCELKKGFTDVESVVKAKLLQDITTAIPDGDVSLTFSATLFRIKTPEYSIVFRILDGTYPNVEQFNPKKSKTVIEFDTEQLKNALEGALVVALDDKTNIVRMEMLLDGVRISAESENHKAVEEIETEVKGKPFKLSFNGKYMVDALETVESKRVTLGLEDHLNPIYFTTKGNDDFQIVLPYRTH